MTNHPNRSKVKDWPAYLLNFRQRHSLSQFELADYLLIDEGFVRTWEDGIFEPKPYLKLALMQIEYQLERQKLCLDE